MGEKLMAKVIIIGAGLTGISTAYHLEKNNFFDYIMVEKDNSIGGLCRSIYQDGFTFDYTGHLLHASDQHFQQLLSDVVGIDTLNSIFRRSYIYSQEIYTKYPFQINLYGLPPKTIAECIEGFATRKKSKKRALAFYDFVLENFGKGIAKHFFFPFQKKIFSYNLKKVTSTWMGRFVPSTSLEQMIRGAVYDATADTNVGYNAHFYYPKHGGIYAWINRLAQQLKNPIQTECAVKTINMQEKYVIFSNGHKESFQTLITTMPLDHLLNTLQEKTNSSLKQAAKYLVCNSVVNFNLGIARPSISDKHWIYFPESQYPFYRLGFPHNFASSMAPEGHSSLYGEFSFIKKSSRSVQTTLNDALGATKRLFNLDQKEIVTEKIIPISHAYVIYDFWREKNIPTIHKRLQEHTIYSIGRYGEWKYASMQEAVLDGKKMATELLATMR